MSHVVDLEIEVKDLECLAKAAQRLGLELVKDQKTFRWYMTHMGDFPLPAGFTKEDMGHCDHVMRIPGDNKAYEIGVCKRRDGKQGFTLLWDFWQGGYGLQEKIGKDGGLLKQGYAAEVAKKQMLRAGYKFTETKDQQGNVMLTFTE
jgi:hypothetical protein